MKTMKNFRVSGKNIVYESIVTTFKSGGAYIPASKRFAGKQVRVFVLLNA